MKRAITLCACLLLGGAALPSHAHFRAKDDGFEAFWQKFKAAVISGDKETVVGLSRFPIRMPRRVPNIKDAADLRLRYREVFNKPVNAAKCFASDDATRVQNPDTHIDCFDGKGDNVAYVFKRTKTGWKFTELDQYTLRD
jgi:hypothetical protein